MDEIRNVAQRGGTVTYGRLMNRYRISRGRAKGIAEVLGVVSHREACLVGISHRPPHHITAAVVRASTQYPSGGFFGLEGTPESLERSERQYRDPILSPTEKRYVERIRQHLRVCRLSGD